MHGCVAEQLSRCYHSPELAVVNVFRIAECCRVVCWRITDDVTWYIVVAMASPNDVSWILSASRNLRVSIAMAYSCLTIWSNENNYTELEL